MRKVPWRSMQGEVAKGRAHVLDISQHAADGPKDI